MLIIKCNLRRSKSLTLKRNVETREDSARVQGCLNHPPVQEEGNRQSCGNHRGISLLSIAKFSKPGIDVYYTGGEN